VEAEEEEIRILRDECPSYLSPQVTSLIQYAPIESVRPASAGQRSQGGAKLPTGGDGGIVRTSAASALTSQAEGQQIG
jgi:hypothetical protein